MDAAGAAKVFAALGNEGRLFIFRLLAAAGPEGVRAGEISRQTGQLQNTTSNSLAILTHAGLITPRRDGRSIIYAVVHARFTDAMQFLAGDISEDLILGRPVSEPGGPRAHDAA